MKLRPVHFVWIFCLLAGAALLLARPQQAPAPRPAATPAIAGPGIKAEFSLTDHNGQAVTEKSWPDKYLVVYFGFTHCPDVCPLGLNRIAEALGKLNETQLEKLQPLFVTVDPARDDAASLAQYVPLFHDKIVGMTGTQDQINAVKKSFRVYAEKAGDGPDYMVNHSAFTYLMNPDGSLHDVFPHEATADELAEGFRKALP